MQDKTKKLVGKVVVAPKANCTISDIKAPIAKDILVLSASDFKTGTIKFGEDEYPILAKDVIKYDNQPVLAVFGPSLEEVEMYCKSIEISYTPLQASDLSSDLPVAESSEQILNYKMPVVASFDRTYGDLPVFDPAEVLTFHSYFSVAQHSSSTIRGQRIRVLYDEGRVYIKASSQWPMHLKKCLAKELDIDVMDITLNTDDYYSPNDQLLIQPTLTAIVSAVASKMTGCVVEFSIQMTAFQPAVEVDFETVVSRSADVSENSFTIIDHKVSAIVNMGAFPICSKEYCIQLFAGLVPSYPLKHLDIKCSAVSSSQHPSNFFNDLGYSMGLAASENHFNLLAHKLAVIPSKFKEGLFNSSVVSSAESSSLETSVLFTEIKDLVRNSTCSHLVGSALTDCSAASSFQRLFSAYNQIGSKLHGVNPFINYSRGIGIACGEGTQDFSTLFPYTSNYSLTSTLTEGHKLVVSTGLEGSANQRNIWSDIIEEHLRINRQDIIFIGINDEDSVDIGPSVLARTVRMVPMLIESSCKIIKHRLENGERAPITTTVSMDTNNSSYLFNSNSCAGVTVSLHIDSQSLCPVIDKICARINFGKVFDVSSLKAALKRQITMTILEVCPCTKNSFEIDIILHSDSSKPSGSASSLVRGLIISAFIDALSQACGHTIYKIPVSEHDMLGIVKKSLTDNSVKTEAADEV